MYIIAKDPKYTNHNFAGFYDEIYNSPNYKWNSICSCGWFDDISKEIHNHYTNEYYAKLAWARHHVVELAMAT